MGMIYELLKLPDQEKKKFLRDVVRQETAEKLKSKSAKRTKE